MEQATKNDDRDAARGRDYLRLMRVHQWPKNLLLFVPLIASQNLLEAGEMSKATLAFLAFSLVASGNYAVNDLFDVDADRRHPSKRRRPIASGRISPVGGLLTAALCLALGFALSAALPVGFAASLLGYLALSLSYSLIWRRLLLIDVVALGALFILRVVAGAQAIEVSVSFWLFAFSLFFFTSLALMKRCSELHNLEAAGQSGSHGRAYRVTDLPILRSLGVAAAVMSVLVVALYIDDPATAELYARPDVLWLAGPLLLYWIGRVWIKTGRGEMSEDPLVYSVRDPASWGVALLAVIVVLAAG
ncbi:MAG: UbiA family prenyltransferase [Acidimicrobiia bacterium]|nr:UbiA family prenyltransferase [Acidimicrobiia bacterium]